MRKSFSGLIASMQQALIQDSLSGHMRCLTEAAQNVTTLVDEERRHSPTWRRFLPPSTEGQRLVEIERATPGATISAVTLLA
ncbi:hypothetical protein ABC977_08840 [Thioalkalicoccus limnaeus]|uniref:Uncharacterized protein n=2 Tax=Thioalkalicoccus limnaeus TaxID=120681 RepID=A0ABV4BDB4_9GAMM